MPLNLRKTFMMRVAIVLMVTLSASCFAADVAIKGHLVDVSCAARKASRPDFLPTHSNSCMQMPSCNRSGFGVFYLNNRGYGGSGGRPTEAANIADARAAYDHLIARGVPAERIVAFGESLGSGQAVRLAAERRVAAIVLEAPLTSTVDVGRRVYFWLPLRWLVADRYDNERSIRAVRAPVLILHGERDQVIPVAMGRRIYQAANEPKRIELFAEGGHNDLFEHGAWEKARDFIAGLIR